MSLPWLEPGSTDSFPPLEQALTSPDGLLAAGGDLGVDRLLDAYGRGIFPWFEAGQPILWWSPDPRLVLFTERLRVSRSLARLIRKHDYSLSIDRAFPAVMEHCAISRRGSGGTWITDEMISAYSNLQQQGHAHSVEVWNGARLAGGLYGVVIGRMFFGESMFSEESNTSKLALFYLVEQLKRWEFPLIDCQVRSDHLVSLGAEEISRHEFITRVNELTALPPVTNTWQFDADVIDANYEFQFQDN